MSQLDKFEVKLVDVKPMNILYSRQNMSITEFDKYYDKLFKRIAADNLTMNGGVLAIYHSEEFDPDDSDVAPGGMECLL